MNILMTASEVFPYAKTGGLADVTSALSKSLKKLGHNVSIIMPKYQMVGSGGFALEALGSEISIPISNRWEKTRLYKTYMDGSIPVYLIDNKRYYDRPYLYGTSKGDYEDNAERFIYFSRAVPEICKYLKYKPDIIHCNDWQTGLIPVYLKTLYSHDPMLKDTRTLFTIHNLAYQGIFWHLDMHLTNLGWDIFNPEGIEYYGKMNLLKGGIVFSDILTTVSKTYSREIQSEKFGEGMDGVLRSQVSKLFGVINGMDYDEWDPAKDIYIKKRYAPESLDGKYECKRDLLEIFGLPESKTKPVIGIISRLADQKGFDLIADAIEDILDLGAIFILLGTGDEKYHKIFKDIKDRHKYEVGIKLGFDAKLAHKIEAGADMFLMPSRYEPCGLNQMYSLKYGTIPIVRAVGGLNDTIKNYKSGKTSGNGFKFKNYTVKDMMSSIKKAVKVFNNKPEWRKLIQNAMSEDHSWKTSAKQYIKLYRMAMRG